MAACCLFHNLVGVGGIHLALLLERGLQACFQGPLVRLLCESSQLLPRVQPLPIAVHRPSLMQPAHAAVQTHAACSVAIGGEWRQKQNENRKQPGKRTGKAENNTGKAENTTWAREIPAQARHPPAWEERRPAWVRRRQAWPRRRQAWPRRTTVSATERKTRAKLQIPWGMLPTPWVRLPTPWPKQQVGTRPSEGQGFDRRTALRPGSVDGSRFPNKRHSPGSATGVALVSFACLTGLSTEQDD